MDSRHLFGHIFVFRSIVLLGIYVDAPYLPIYSPILATAAVTSHLMAIIPNKIYILFGMADLKSASPQLIDTQAKNYLYYTLSRCHDTRVKYNTIVLNVGVFFAFVCISGGILYYLYRSKPSPQEQYNKLMKDQEYVLSKIRYYQEQNQKIATMASSYSSTITDLPIVPNIGI